MVAYNFQKQFCEPIKTGTKTHTIRRRGKRRHVRAGESLQLYTGQRTSACRKIVDDRQCIRVAPIEIFVSAVGITSICVDREPVDDLEGFAREDGFASLVAMSEFWIRFHGFGTFTGVMIFWG